MKLRERLEALKQLREERIAFMEHTRALAVELGSGLPEIQVGPLYLKVDGESVLGKNPQGARILVEMQGALDLNSHEARELGTWLLKTSEDMGP